jgi:cellulose synthase/poly-beta-1,6-N-acetylglucosamine synthase-like glycosyltransferase
VAARAGTALTRAGTALALAGAAHAALNARLVRRPVPAPAGGNAGDATRARPRVSVLVPARDEAASIGACVRALVGEHGSGHEVIVLDDESADATADLARAAGARVVAGVPRPPGWLGKPWACEQLRVAADPASEILVFVDADVLVAPGGIDAAVDLVLHTGLDITAHFPRQAAGTIGERLVQPLLQWSWLTTLPVRIAERSPRPSLTAACGQLVVVRRRALESVGGFGAVRGAVIDDVALVRVVKACGGRGGVADGSAVAHCRMYTGWAQLRDGYTKSLWAAFGSAGGAAAATGLLVLGWVVPAVAMARGSRAGALGYVAGVASRVISARRTGGRVADAPAHPVSILLLAWLTARSVWASRYGDPQWKGRPVVLSRPPTA